ncbi:MerR family transcriptional regulator [Amycolatopsis acidicola]|uniref:MerR family transcriptional regulator n=1 Tax=Amycolatopsis acidicola TaxID=2596893 RepID=A0A5N0UN96_9PSEU|nr:MerR family transcriptional regulator [Amycolatopsis acidicola]KAA9150720.1 MerR family transcriptional regulator [Amycolatopsis acidicola]
MKSSDLAIGEVAARFGLPTHVLRHWESVGLLAPARDGGQRRYSHDELVRVALILMGKRVGLSLRQVRALVENRDAAEEAALLRAQVEALDRRIAEAREAKALLEHALECPLSFHECPDARAAIESWIPAVENNSSAAPVPR